MVQNRRRVSYVIPAPTGPVPKLQLPPHGTSRLGLTGPLLVPLSPAEGETQKRDTTSSQTLGNGFKHPRHRLGISSLALDTSTVLSGRGAPEGILYSAGRDGLVISWDLGIPMKKRKGSATVQERGGRGNKRDWEVMTGWADEDDAGEEDEVLSDGDIIGDVVVGSPRRRRAVEEGVLPYERRWETDLGLYKAGKPSEFRQSAQINSDWVNDILLCNNQQTVISASSDGTVKSWSPHLPNSSAPSTIGTHSDYVRCLAHSREQNWVASGSFDRTIKLWDLTRESTGDSDPFVTFHPPDANAPKSSIYALAADPFGTTIASGSPERVVRLWDPRTGKRTGKLVGHTDNIRAILVSEDARYLLTGSADASIKLWSLASQRCLHTFTHHTESVWSLHSSHPSLEVFYSGDRAGLVCKVDVEDCSDVSEGECVLLCQDADPNTPSSDGINKIVAMDDNLLWTASGHSNIKRWGVPQRRAARAANVNVLMGLDADGERYLRSESPSPLSTEMHSEASTRPSTALGPSGSLVASVQSLSDDTWPTPADRDDDTRLYGIPFESLVRLISPNESFAYVAGRGRDPEVATLYSAASIKSVPRQAPMRSPTMATFKPGTSSGVQSPRTDDTMHHVSSARADYEERELASDAVPLSAEPDEVIKGEHGLVRSLVLNDRIHALSVDTSGEVAVWDVVRGVCMGRYGKEDVEGVSCAGSWSGSGRGKEHSPREALEAVRERIEGEAVVSQWATADTKAGVLTVHLTERSFEAEVYADEVGYANDRRFNDESKINLGKWTLRNLFLGFIREEQRLRRNQDPDDDNNYSPEGVLGPSFARISSHTPSRKNSALFTNSIVVQSPKMIPALPPTAALPIRTSPLLASLIPLHLKENSLPAVLQPTHDGVLMPRRHRSATVDEGDPYVVAPPSSGNSVSDYFTLRNRQSLATGMPATPDDVTGKQEAQQGGIMGRLKNFGKNKRPPSEVSSSPVIGSLVPSADLATALEEASRNTVEIDISKSPVQMILSGPITPPPSAEAPTYTIPSNTIIYISEEAAPSYTTVYRGTVANAKYDLKALEEAMPLWLMEYLLLNKTPVVPPHQKISFVLLPWPTPNPDDQLPELLNTTQSKLTSSRYLRVRKLVVHVQEKLEKMSPRSQIDFVEYETQASGPKVPAENEYEILCNDVVLHLGMSLAVIRQYIWKQNTELAMYYRKKSPAVA